MILPGWSPAVSLNLWMQWLHGDHEAMTPQLLLCKAADLVWN